MPNFYCRKASDTNSAHLPYPGTKIIANTALEAAVAYRALGTTTEKILVSPEPECFTPGSETAATLPTYS